MTSKRGQYIAAQLHIHLDIWIGNCLQAFFDQPDWQHNLHMPDVHAATASRGWRTNDRNTSSSRLRYPRSAPRLCCCGHYSQHSTKSTPFADALSPQKNDFVRMLSLQPPSSQLEFYLPLTQSPIFRAARRDLAQTLRQPRNHSRCAPPPPECRKALLCHTPCSQSAWSESLRQREVYLVV